MTGLIAGAASDRGRVREGNEDSHRSDPDGQIFIVADGMGGHAAGEVASQLAVAQVHAAWSSDAMRRRADAYAARGDATARRELFQAVREAVMRAHLEIIAAARADQRMAGMGTTFTGFMVAGGDAIFAHAGDSRAYLVRDDIAIQLTEDHTVLARLLAAGVEASGGDGDDGDPNRWAGVLTNALGIGDVTRVATFVVPLYPADRVILMSDGISEYVAEAELAALLSRAASPQRAANTMVERALERGGADNATAIVVRVLEVGETRSPAGQRDRDAATVARCLLFEDLTLQERLRALRIATLRELEAGRELPAVALGDRVAHVILEGEVAAASPLGPADLVYPTALVGGTALPTPLARATTAVRLLTVRRGDFIELSDDEADIGVKLYAALARLMAR